MNSFEEQILKAEHRVIAMAGKLVYDKQSKSFDELTKAIIELSNITGGPGVIKQ